MMENKQNKGLLTTPRLSLPFKGSNQLMMHGSRLNWTPLPDLDTVTVPIPMNNSWGWLPALSLSSGTGIFLVALAYEAGRLATQWADPLFWLGLLVLFLPVAARLLSPKASRRERIALIIIVGLGLYLIKYLQYPLYFAYHDEFSHIRTAQDLMTSGHLFHENPLLPISSYYPGIEIATSAVSTLTGLSIFSTGTLIIGIARLVLALSLFLFYEQLSKSPRLAGVATILYMANPQFLFFQAIFSYESLAIPLAAFVLFTLSFHNYSLHGRHVGLNIVAWLGIGAVVITHHITSFALVAVLILWTTISFLRNRHQKETPSLGFAALLSLVLCIFWLIYTGDIVLGYLSPHVTSAAYQIQQILAGENSTRQLFTEGTGFIVPWWERAAAIVSLALIMLSLPFGLFKLWLRYRKSTAALALAGGALMYPVSQALRFTNAGAESGIRATEFLFLSLGFILAIETSDLWMPQVVKWRRYALILSMLAILLVGQETSGEVPTWARVPGPYLIVADQRSIEPEGINAANWAFAYLGPNHRIGSDRINTLLMATDGRQWGYTSADNMTPSIEKVVLSPQFGVNEKKLLKQQEVRYLVVDLRLHGGLPYVGYDFNEPASHTLKYILPVPLASMRKFDGAEHVNRVFDSGNIAIYDVGAITSAP